MKHNMTQKRLLIFLVVTFLLTWVPTILYNACGYEYETGGMQFLLGYSMLCPTIAVLVVRFITREGFAVTGEGSLLLGIDFSGKKWVWYIVALFMPMLYQNLGDVFTYLIFPKAFYPNALKDAGISLWTALLYPLFGISMSVIVSFAALGEEIGWRGYMMPKLEELFGTGKAIIIGGIIWGVWHFPANYAGHNYGTDYWGEPWSGFIVFTISTIAMGMILTYLTKETGSVWPAAFMHAINNSGARTLGFFYAEDAVELVGGTIVIGALGALAEVIVALAFIGIVMGLVHRKSLKVL